MKMELEICINIVWIKKNEEDEKKKLSMHELFKLLSSLSENRNSNTHTKTFNKEKLHSYLKNLNYIRIWLFFGIIIFFRIFFRNFIVRFVTSWVFYPVWNLSIIRPDFFYILNIFDDLEKQKFMSVRHRLSIPHSAVFLMFNNAICIVYSKTNVRYKRKGYEKNVQFQIHSLNLVRWIYLKLYHSSLRRHLTIDSLFVGQRDRVRWLSFSTQMLAICMFCLTHQISVIFLIWVCLAVLETSCNSTCLKHISIIDWYWIHFIEWDTRPYQNFIRWAKRR